MIYFVVFFLVFSVIVNGLLIWYVRNLLKNYGFLVEQVVDTQADLFEYADHLREVYQMETYYGDSTLEGLLKHTVSIEEKIQNTIIVGQEIYNERGTLDE